MNSDARVRPFLTEALRPPASGFEDTSAPLDFQHMVEEAEVGICITQDGRVAYANPKYAQLHGMLADEMVGIEYASLVHPGDRERVAEIVRLRANGQHRSAYESRNVRRDGRVFDSRVFGSSILYRGRQANLVTTSDISELACAHRLSAWHARMLASNELLCRSGSGEFDMARRSVRLSVGAQSLLNVGGATEGLSLYGALHRIPADERRDVVARWRRAVPGDAFEFTHKLRRADGSVLHVLQRGLLEAGDGGANCRPVVMLQDITAQTEATVRADRVQTHHPITGLPMRALLLKQTEAALLKAQREGRSLAMLYLRIPDLDRHRDLLGMAIGDQLTNTMAIRIIESCEPGDMVSHLSGGKFMVLLESANGTDESAALKTAARIQEALKVPAIADSNEFFVKGRIGISLFPASATSAIEMVEHARMACARSESDITCFTPETGRYAVRRIKLEAALQRALERHELSLQYQPQVDLRDGTVVGAEALLRWKSEEFGDVSPSEFVPIAEETGMIVEIGAWVFRTACEQSVAWIAAGLPALRVSVNLSARQLEQSDISHRLQSMLLSTGADPTHIGIEVTESVLTRDFAHARRVLNELSAIGIEISLDDFGTGYSNMSSLRALSFDVLKIDRSLVHDVTAAPEDVSITRAVLALAQGLKIKVLAEGVETEGQLKLLISNGCDYMQGYIFSKPLWPDAMAEMLRDGQRLPDQMLVRNGKQPTLLLVDDEENVLSSLRRLLRSDGYRIVIARSGAEGLEKLAEHDVDVIVSDQRMPGMTGVEFLRRAKELYPSTVRLVLSGYTELQSITDAVNEGAIYKLLTKPWDDTQLRAHIAEAFRCKEMADENRRLSTEVRNANLELAVANERQEQMLALRNEQLSLEETRALNAQFLLENLPVAVLGIDPEGMIAFMNKQAGALLGEAHAMVGCAAEHALPTDWLPIRNAPQGTHIRVAVDGAHYVLSCSDMGGQAGCRGQLLSIVPNIPTQEAMA